MAKIFRNLSKIAYINKKKISQTSICYTIPELLHKNEHTYQDSRTEVITKIEHFLNIHKRTALKLVNENRKLITTSPTLIGKNLEILRIHDLNPTIALKYPFLLSSVDLKDKLNIMKQLNHPLSTTVVLAGLPMTTLKKIIHSSKNFGDRIFVLSQLLQISPKETCELLYNRNFLINRNLFIIKDILQSLKEFGISPEDVYKDPWILRYSLQIIKERILYLKNLNHELSTPKPWMLRSPMEVLDNYLKRRLEHRQILGSASLAEYLSKKLECTEDQAKYLIYKMPALRTKSLKTLSDIINFLYSKGFKSFHIYRVPKILVHSVETTKKRLEKMENAGIKADSLYMLTKSKKQFTQNFEAMIKSKRGI